MLYCVGYFYLAIQIVLSSNLLVRVHNKVRGSNYALPMPRIRDANLYITPSRHTHSNAQLSDFQSK